MFGGYNLNKVLSNVEVYRFETSRWEDEHGNELGMLILYAFFSVIPQRLNFICRRFRTLSVPSS